MLERWNDDKMDALDSKVDALDSKVDALDSKVDALDAKVNHLDEKVNHLDVRLTRVEVKVDEGFKRTDAELLEQRREMKAGFERLNDRLTHTLLAVIGAGATIAAAIFTAWLT